MAKANKQSAKSAAKAVIAKAAAPAPVVTPAPAEATRAKRVATQVNRLPAPEARAHNRAIPAADPKQPVAAGVVFTAKGTNPKKTRVYGYDNGSGNMGVPKAAKVVVVPGSKLPKGVASAQWELLQKEAGKTVADLYNNKVSSRTVRRAYRSGAIRFVA